MQRLTVNAASRGVGPPSRIEGGFPTVRRLHGARSYESPLRSFGSIRRKRMGFNDNLLATNNFLASNRRMRTKRANPYER
jgi:hypothetical protein